MGDEEFTDDRCCRRHPTRDGGDLYVIAGRILSQLKTDQCVGHMPPSAVIVVAVNDGTITVQVHIQDIADFEDIRPAWIRRRVATVCERYLDPEPGRSAHCRCHSYSCQVRVVRGRLDALLVAGLLG
jgi:hypothetical protein